MSAEFLEAFVEAGTYTARHHTQVLLAGQLDWNGVLALCEGHRQAGVCSLLLHGDGNAYFDSMAKSCGAFMEFLQHAVDARVTLSKALPLLDAINGGYWDAADTIAARLPQEVNPDYEYEEDFKYRRFLIEFGVRGSDGRAALASFADAAGETDEARVAVCEALVAKDEKEFHENLCIFLEQDAEQIEAKIARGALTDAQWSWQRYYCSEGLALLRIAQRRGIGADVNYLRVPQELLDSPAVNFAPDAWRQA